ncbi:ParB/RepB/Spo0J family partition protein [Paracoccus yeei]|jgi:ParB-like chromosome segregation protein Spo0J|uniref:ParB/RepB/Spo0J family partition protein n=1 Tax=Paracoccus yeei TaxID=147645 RepID=UPI003BF8AE86
MKRGDRSQPKAVSIAFEHDCITIAIAELLPLKTLPPTLKSGQKYRQIAASIREVGLVEPPVVARDPGQPGKYLLLDGHVRIEVLKDIGGTEVECLVATDDEAFTYNKRISRLSAVQEH